MNYQDSDGNRLNDPKCFLEDLDYTKDKLHFVPASDYVKFCKAYLPSLKVFKKVDESFLPDCYKK